MKNSKLIISILIIILSTISCEDAVHVDLDNAPPKLVIDASIKWEKGTTGVQQKIKLTTTTDYYSTIIPVATGATVVVTNTTLATPVSYQFIEDGQTGEYNCTNFKPVINNIYELTVIYKGETYNATSTFMATPIIEKTEQSIKPGIKGDDVYEIKFFFQDDATKDNFYLVGAKSTHVAYPEYGVLSDEFSQGNLMFAFYRNEKIKQGDVINLNVQGITEQYYNYMNKLISVAGTQGTNPFATPPATLRGNIVNKTNPDNFPLGFFHLAEIDSEDYTVK